MTITTEVVVLNHINQVYEGDKIRHTKSVDINVVGSLTGSHVIIYVKRDHGEELYDPPRIGSMSTGRIESSTHLHTDNGRVYDPEQKLFAGFSEVSEVALAAQRIVEAISLRIESGEMTEAAMERLIKRVTKDWHEGTVVHRFIDNEGVR